jgi:hypothetical protein
LLIKNSKIIQPFPYVSCNRFRASSTFARGERRGEVK